MSDETLLVISTPGVPPYSARGLTQTLAPILSLLRRTANGNLVDVSAPQFRKYKSSITCTDQDVPAFSGIWPGMEVTVDCVPELAYLTAGGSPERTVVADSSRVEGDFTFYRPQIVFKVVNHSVSLDEYAADLAWTLDLEEV